MRSLRHHDHGPEVMFLQRLLNKQGADPYVREDGDYGPRTATAVRAFRQRRGLGGSGEQVDGSVWAALGAVDEIRHPVRGFAQPTDTSCWSAAATMMTGTVMSVGTGRARLARNGTLRAGLENVETFVHGMGWHLVNHSSAPAAPVLMNAVRRGPLWVAFVGTHFGHAVVFSGMLTDNASDGTGTVFIVHDPWPPGRGAGSRYGTTYLGQQVWLRSRTLPRPVPAMVGYAAQ